MPEAAPTASDAGQPDTAVTLLAVVDAVVGDLNPGRKPASARLDSRLDRELGIDSLGRAELVARIERAFGVSLPERILVEAESPRDFLAAVLARQGVAPPRQAVLIAMPATPVAVGEPSHLGTLCEVLDWHAESHPDRVHIIFSEPRAAARPLSYVEDDFPDRRAPSAGAGRGALGSRAHRPSSGFQPWVWSRQLRHQA